MSFGFGVGDIVTCTQMALKTIDALRSAGSEFEGLRLELSSLTSVLSSLKAEADGPMPLINSASAERQEQMRSLLRNCTASMEDLQGLVTKYKSWNSDKKRDCVAWMRFAAKDKKGPREKLAIHTASINIFLTTLSHGSLARLEFLIKNGPRATPSEQPGSDGVRGIGNFVVTGSGLPRTKRNGSVVWQQIGSALADEGIRDEEVEGFQEELKAYARYLVRGETPFWKRPKTTVAREHMSLEKAMCRRSSRLEERLSPVRERDRARYREEQQRINEGMRRLRERPAEPSVAEELHRAKKQRLREEVKEARQVQGNWQGVRDKTESAQSLRRAKEAPTDTLEDVVAFADQFEGLFEFEGVPDRTQQGIPSPSGANSQTSYEDPEESEDTKSDGGPISEGELRRMRINPIRWKIEELVRKHDQYLEEGKRDRVHDLDNNAIPEQVELLKEEGVKVLSTEAWNWRFRCDECELLIPGLRYHCDQCRSSSGESSKEGNWDICEECWKTGSRCPGNKQHRRLLIRDFE